MSRLVLWACILFVSVKNAEAVECQISGAGGDSHWAWRLSDGRRCRYKGESGMDKSLLQWARAGERPDRPDGRSRPEVETTQAILEVQPVPSEVTKMLPIMPPQPTFEDRWRLH